ncbi:MAG: extracellular solute-binding protein [Sphaerochaeta sp.]|jgi:putative aldouronate transport system substrate-binding protein|uniref:Extracellular solute-binding protein n=2 Tax=root TaxID=1 RepID=A0ABY4D9Z4_9SPIR|nr:MULTISPECIES: extracellular solute-binding protein [Sphaerochaeta]MDD2395558.1 extracellular solute-binding protein [Sphaerochaeta sp.]MDD4037674.1 extracellular solute-binding protein [Sphaerochaeta sp.]MDX9985359.1 extracellular solute-binding protein [Sphaerochaeta sp.]MEA5029899.1 extracellular solute-binding protein [Sphaerochaeta associata]MEA5105953.1 extracellular solute-binding protein [Sphaerochaeta associata]
MKKSVMVLFVLVVLLMSIPAAGNKEVAVTVPAAPTAGLNASGFPIVAEPVTLKVFGVRDQNTAEWKNVKMLTEYQKLSNVIMDYQEVPTQGYDEKKSLLFASNDLPDVFVRAQLSKVEIAKYGMESGQLIPLNDLLKQYAPNFMALMAKYPTILASITSADGNIYALPELDLSNTGRMGFKQWINKEWLAKLGLKAPTTTDELITVLRAFRDKDPNGNGLKDEIPLGIREASSIYVLGGSFGLDHQMKETINIENGKVHIWLKDAKFKSYLQFLNQLYEEKLLWKDYYKRDLPSWRSNLSNALFGAFYMPYSDVFLKVENQFTGYAPIKGPYGDQLWSDANSGVLAVGAFAISNVCTNPEVAMRWVDYFYSEEGSLFFRYGIENETYTLDANGTPVFVDSILKDPKGFMTALGQINLVPGGGFPQVITNDTDGVVASALTKEVSAMMVPYLPEQVYLQPSFTQEESEEFVTIVQDLYKYRDEAVTKFILGEWKFDKWDEYCATLDKIGIAKLEKLYQQAFDRL